MLIYEKISTISGVVSVGALRLSKRKRSKDSTEPPSKSHKRQAKTPHNSSEGQDAVEGRGVSPGGSCVPEGQFRSPRPSKRGKRAAPETKKKVGAPRLPPDERTNRQKKAAREAKARKAADKHDREAKITSLESDIAELGNHRGKSSSHERNSQSFNTCLTFGYNPFYMLFR